MESSQETVRSDVFWFRFIATILFMESWLILSLIGIDLVIGGRFGSSGGGLWATAIFMSKLPALFTPILLEGTLLKESNLGRMNKMKMVSV